LSNRLNTLFSLEDKVIVITGATGLLGTKHAEAIANFGGHPILLDLSLNSLKTMSERISKKYGVISQGYQVDISNENQVKNSAKIIFEKFGKIDGLVNNAGNNPKVEESSNKNFSRLENFSLINWNKDISVGLTGSFLCSKHFGYLIAKNPNGGSIVNISSDLGLIAPDQRLYEKKNTINEKQPVKPVSYSVVKTGLIGLTRYISTYWAEQNVRCNAICPGGVENGQPKDFLKKISYRIPLKRLAKKDEYQGTLIWMLSDASNYLNGAVIPVDGGRTVW
jgi:NAD(P)-dependent dehydrogenase (short-subunit alcohol dehydrogenase family)